MMNISNSPEVIDRHSLYYAHEMSRLVCKPYWFAPYRDEYIASQTGLKKKAIECYNTLCEVKEDISRHFQETVSSVLNPLQNKIQSSHIIERCSHALTALINLVKEAVQTLFAQIQPHIKPATDWLKNTFFPFNPIKGKRQFFLLPRSVEKFLGKYLLYPFVTSHHFETSECFPGTKERMASRVTQVTEKLKSSNQELLNPTGQVPFDYQVKTLSSPAMNAYAAAGSGIAIFSKLIQELHAAVESGEIPTTTVTLPDGAEVTLDLKKVQLDDVLAGLIGHEMSHIASRHGCGGIALQLIFGLIYATFGVFLSMSPTIDMWLHKIENIIMNFCSRSSEYEADTAGAFIAHQANYNIFGSLYLDEFFARKEGDWNRFWHRYTEFGYTHPHPENRKRSTFAAIATIAPELLAKNIINHKEGSRIISAPAII